MSSSISEEKNSGDFKETKDVGDTNSDSNSINEYRGFDEKVQNDVQRLARTYTNSGRSVASDSSADLVKYLTNMTEIPGVPPFDSQGLEESLDPNSENFKSKYWVKNMRKLQESNSEYYKPSKLSVAYKNLRAYGVAADSDYQPTVASAIPKLIMDGVNLLKSHDESRYFDILKTMDGILRPGEVTVVLGRPGSGCSTFLKTIAAQTYGYHVDKNSQITYDGLTPKDISKHFRGDVVYSAETDVHFPHLTVGDTLEFAARLRTPQNRGDVDRESYAKHMASVYMATYGLSHTRNTNVGNDFVRGVSGGERKRVSIAEASLCGANIQCWDNATRGLDAATALEFIRALKTSAAILDSTPLIAIYQCSQDAYNLFDNVVLLYEGYQIFFGKGSKARDFFEGMGYKCPERQTTADFLTSLTNPAERVIIPGFEDKVPRTAKEFESYWKNSPEYAALSNEIDEHFDHCNTSDVKQVYHDSHVARQANHISPKSPYTVSFFMQTRYIMSRNFLRTKGNPSIFVFSIVAQGVMGLVLSSVFYNLDSTTSSFYYRGAALFFAVLFNAFASLLEIMSLFESRPIVEKQKNFALYRPSADALASIVTELPTKLFMSVAFNFPLYFMVNLRRNPGRFFFYWLISFMCTLVMSHLFRSIGAVSTSIAGAMTPATVLLLAMVIFTGFVIPTPNMLGWSRWINYINPVGYVFEALMDNEFSNRNFKCNAFVPQGPAYQNVDSSNYVCSAQGSKPGKSFVNGSDYIRSQYNFRNTHKWRNFGIVVGFICFFLGVYISLTEFNKGAMQKGEITLFTKSAMKKNKKKAKQLKSQNDLEVGAGGEKVSYKEALEAEKPDFSSDSEDKLPSNSDIFFWNDLTYEVKIKSEHRVILDHVDGWVAPGKVTALMGASGAGKTTLLNCLSERVTTGVITDGTRMVNGHPLDGSFQRSIGYVQQQDLHLPSSTVREALRFSAYLRQPNSVSQKEKDEYVEYIIDLLEMYEYADAIVGVAGEGLNVEQRKRLTIGVELVAKPKLLLFLDEPTSGLDSQTAWSICKLMRKLADRGQAILCTIHQPSAILLQEFDRLLFLQKGGKTVFFGDLGENCQGLINYFEKHGSQPCPPDANPAEWMLEVVGAAPGSHAKQDYFEVWRNSSDYRFVKEELARMEQELSQLPRDVSPEAHKKYAAPIWKQYIHVFWRVCIQNWRSPAYMYSKLFLCLSSALFIGFSFFKAKNSVQGLQNQMFAVFMSLVPFNTLVQQMFPSYVAQRSIYEVREAPSRTYSWFTFFLAQLTSEIPIQFIVGTLSFFCFYYPVGLYRNAEPTDKVNSRGVLFWLLQSGFYIYTTTMGHLCISFNELADNASNLAQFLFTFCLLFCGVLASSSVLPGFWIFMYRANPFTYVIQGLLATGLANTKVECADRELVHFYPPSGQTCAKYMENYIKTAGGYVTSPSATDVCQYCSMSETNVFLKSIGAVYSQRWRNWGLLVAFIFINIFLSIFLYWLARVPKGTREKKKKD